MCWAWQVVVRQHLTAGGAALNGHSTVRTVVAVFEIWHLKCLSHHQTVVLKTVIAGGGGYGLEKSTRGNVIQTRITFAADDVSTVKTNLLTYIP